MTFGGPTAAAGGPLYKCVIITAALASFTAFIVAKDTFPAKKSEAHDRKVRPLLTERKCPIIYMDGCFKV